MPRKLIFIAILMGLSACSNLSTKPTLEPKTNIILAPPLGPARHVEQKITATWPGRQEQFICILELDSNRIAVAGISPAGMSLFNLMYDGKQTLIDKSQLLPPNFSPEQVIRDIQMAYWPPKELSKTLGTAWHVQDSMNQRSIYRNTVLQYSIHYSTPSNIWNGAVDLNHLSEHYRLQISTINHETLSE